MKTYNIYSRSGSGMSIRGVRIVGLTALICAALSGAAQAATVTVTKVDDGVSNVGAAGTLYWAITNCHAGDTIAFNIDSSVYGAGPYYFKGPPPADATSGFGGGLPLIYRKHNLLIDGYTQPGSSPNTHSITQANNAVIKIIIDGRNYGSRGMDYTLFDGTLATSDPPINNASMSNERGGFGNTERALLGIYRSTNVWVRGLAFLSTFSDPAGDQKGICLAHDYDGDTTVYTQSNYVNGIAYQGGSDRDCHVSGCWFGVDPTNKTVAGVSGGLMAIANYRHRDVSGGTRPDLPNVGLIVGVAPGSTNARAEFNVFAGYGYAMDSENLRARFSGNFVGVLPDGVTPYNMPEIDPSNFGNAGNGFFEWGRYDDTVPMIIGTDGDGVNDADEGNLFGPEAVAASPSLNIPNVFDFYSTSRKPYIIAGNRFGIAVDGTRWTNSGFVVFGGLGLNNGTQVRFGSDFNGVSDALEANVVYNHNLAPNTYSFWTNVTGGTMPLPAPSLFQGMNSSPGTTTDSWVSVRGNVFVNNFPTFNPDDTFGNTASQYLTWWNNYIAGVPDTPSTIPTLSSNSTISTLSGTFGVPPANGYTNLVLDLYVPDPEGQTNGALWDCPDFGGTSGWGFVQGKTYLGSYLVSNPASGAFSLNISGLGLAHGTKVTAAITYSAFVRPHIISISRAGGNTTLVWTGDNGGPFTSSAAGGPSSGFGVQRASSVNGPWTTVAFAPANSTTISDATATSFYRIVGPVSGMTTLCAPPVTVP